MSSARLRLAEIVSDSLASATMGSDYVEAPEFSDEPGSLYVARLTNELASRGVTLAASERPPVDPLRTPLMVAARAVIEYDREVPATGGLRDRIDALFNAWNAAAVSPAAPRPEGLEK